MRNLPSNNSVGIEDLWKVMTRINIGQTFNEEGPQMLRTIEQHTTRRRKTELLELLRMIDGGKPDHPASTEYSVVLSFIQ